MTAQPLEYLSQSQISSLLEPLSNEKIKEIIDLLDSWCNVDEEEAKEQEETLEYLMRALDEDRPSYRKLFP